MPGIFWNPQTSVLKAPARIGLPLDPGSGIRDLHPRRQVQHLERGLEDRRQTVVVEKWADQDREGGKSVTPFKSKIVP